MSTQIATIGIIGSGVMGTGITQIALQSNHQVYLYDAKDGAAQIAAEKLQATLNKLVEKNKITAESAQQAFANLVIAARLDELKNCDLVIEAIVENLSVKQELIKQLEALVAENTIIASNTSSLSITAIASQSQHPERIVGYHFFNPVPLMKVVEVIPGIRTQPEIVSRLVDLSYKMGHRPVVAKDTPGFIINHAGRAYGTESLKILNENVANIHEIDRILKQNLGFKMGPFELLDLTGLDVSHPVMESVYEQYYQEPRYRPNVLTKQMLTAKQLGRKTGQGFYRYEAGQKLDEQPAIRVEKLAEYPTVWIAADFEADRQILTGYLNTHQISIDTQDHPAADSLILVASYGEDTSSSIQRLNLDATRTVAIDLINGLNVHRTLMPSLITQEKLSQTAHSIFNLDGNSVSVIQESVGFVAQRVIAMVINLACDIAQQGVATVDDINAAVRLGLGYPHGPISWGDVLGPAKILLILERMTQITADPRYRPSPWLQRRVKLNQSLTFTA
ncbi:3-hydroxyacyl-CoA dehydrogenase [Acinetobacter terrestris]|uniref:3-hydroxyacyl-CoA dehydrogenase n=1 Tax=Acinetobacter terrestris TaxID=2529843 RepID=A0AAW6UQ21_9GAMM|nr:3-hydroxyacyl-CoA dehydrogenase [Acinetobacter terrestris]MDK1683356.1 3-hydroxyacyl-CoA dehydrogenase [Acinetobacter terrestris]